MSSSNGAAAGIVLACFFVLPANAAVDLAALQVTPQRGQTAAELRRDRYECHNFAVDQTGSLPPAVAPEQDRNAKRERRSERMARVLTGAAVGSAVGGVVRAVQDKDPSNGVLAGAAVGAAVGAATSEPRGDSADEDPGDYVRALTACLEGRGYAVAVPDES
jgi:hypothetical protein